MRPLTTVLLLLIGQPLAAQRPADAWINPAQTYLKIPTVQAGIYRIPFADLRKTGLPATTHPEVLQLFHRGEEVAIHVETDFVEFYGTGNDGTLDSALYQPRAAQPHRFYNLYSDTTAYFLTWRLDGGRGLRMEGYEEIPSDGTPPEPFLWLTTRQVYTADYAPGTFYPLGARSFTAAFFSHADGGETYTDRAYQPGETARYSFDLTFFKKTSAAAPRLEVQVLGRNPDAHALELRAGPKRGDERPLGQANFSEFCAHTFRANLDSGDVSPRATVRITLLDRAAPPPNAGGLPWSFAPTYLQVRYPAQPIQFQPALDFELPANPANRSLLEIRNVPESSALYDLSDERRPIRILFSVKNGILRAVVRGTAQPRRMLLINRFLSVLALRPRQFRVFPRKADYLLITHEGLLAGARRYAAYRASAAGGGHDTLVVTMHELADRFHYGEWSPLAMRAFAETARQRLGADFLFLIGQGRWSQLMRRRADRYALDPVPPAGWPAADLPLVMGLGGDAPFVPGLAVGRLNAATPEQVAAYLKKVQEHEAAPPSLGQKRVLHLSGGRSAGQLTQFRNFLDEFRTIADLGAVGVRVQTLAKQSDDPVETLNVTRELNEGVGLVTFFGHSGGTSPDLDIGLCSDETRGYRNRGRYPLLLVNGCDAGDLFFDGGQSTFASNWVNTPDRGAIAVLAHASSGYAYPLRAYSNQLYDVLFRENAFAGKPIGLVQREAIRRLISTPGAGVFDQTHAQQFTLQGDPAVVIFPAQKPDYALEKTALRIENAPPDSLRLTVVLSNLGRKPAETVVFLVKLTPSEGRATEYRLPLPPLAFQDTLRLALPRPAGLSRIDLRIDPETRLNESRRDNNAASLNFDPNATLPDFSAPDRSNPVLDVTFDGRHLADGDLVSARPRIEILLKDENPALLQTDTTALELAWQRPGSTGWERIGFQNPALTWEARLGNAFQAYFRPPTLAEGRYAFRAQGYDASGNAAGALPYLIYFLVKKAETLALDVHPNPFLFFTTFRLTRGGEGVPVFRVRLFSPAGLPVRALTAAAPRAGLNELVWDGTDENGAALPEGLYFYRVSVGEGRAELAGKLLLRR